MCLTADIVKYQIFILNDEVLKSGLTILQVQEDIPTVFKGNAFKLSIEISWLIEEIEETINNGPGWIRSFLDAIGKLLATVLSLLSEFIVLRMIKQILTTVG